MKSLFNVCEEEVLSGRIGEWHKEHKISSAMYLSSVYTPSSDTIVHTNQLIRNGGAELVSNIKWNLFLMCLRKECCAWQRVCEERNINFNLQCFASPNTFSLKGGSTWACFIWYQDDSIFQCGFQNYVQCLWSFKN